MPRKNMVTAAEQPTPMVTGPSLERMSARQTLDRAVELMDYSAFRATGDIQTVAVSGISGTADSRVRV